MTLHATRSGLRGKRRHFTQAVAAAHVREFGLYLYYTTTTTFIENDRAFLFRKLPRKGLGGFSYLPIMF